MTTQSELDINLPELPEDYRWSLGSMPGAGGIPQSARLSIIHKDTNPILGEPVVSQHLDLGSASSADWVIGKAIDALHSRFHKVLRWQRALDELRELVRASQES